MLSSYSFGTLPPQPDTWFEMLEAPTEYADFSYDASGLISSGDSIASLAIAAMPSGIGEVVLSRLQLFPNSLVTVWITGGVPGRTYIYALQITTALTRNFTVLIGQVADPTLAQCPIPPPPNPGFGSQTTWQA